MSRGGIYTGGHTKIFLSEEGTIWPDDPKTPHEKPAKRWSNESGLSDSDEPKSPSAIKAARYRYLAQLATAYRMKQKVRELPQPPRELWPAMHAAGGIIEWVNKDAKALDTFWHMVAEQESGKWDPRVKPPRRKR
jgi:hypothetical protein